jgi:hypothetical protein
MKIPKYFHLSHIKGLFKEHGLAFAVIFTIWEVVEIIMFPLLFIWLGNNINPWFLTGAPVSWLLCVHPIVVPITWAIWIKISRRTNESKDIQD